MARSDWRNIEQYTKKGKLQLFCKENKIKIWHVVISGIQNGIKKKGRQRLIRLYPRYVKVAKSIRGQLVDTSLFKTSLLYYNYKIITIYIYKSMLLNEEKYMCNSHV